MLKAKTQFGLERFGEPPKQYLSPYYGEVERFGEPSKCPCCRGGRRGSVIWSLLCLLAPSFAAAAHQRFAPPRLPQEQPALFGMTYTWFEIFDNCASGAFLISVKEKLLVKQ